PEEVCQAHNLRRPDRLVPDRVIATQSQMLRRTLSALSKEGFRHVYTLHAPQEVEAAVIDRQPLRSDRRTQHGPFDILGDVHGCYDELLALLEKLGYRVGYQPGSHGLPEQVVLPPPGRTAIFVGDLGDRGPNTPAV